VSTYSVTLNNGGVSVAATDRDYGGSLTLVKSRARERIACLGYLV
jgi:hypothetical protein